ncbi:cell division protein FtsQ/DivIB [Anaeromicropila populeti]|uniref:Cell division protein FtsQ n=1 Tax=Anaeromicropila populeti TaxID=37658 RepID=A0A1I6KWZ1_9FIRM|nr:cell division protein FtsQ/DivIB [Anaeromicropila populeti]SFR95731.1 cell division protein FtsQ [Anaeromicropila populeti]
MKNSIQNEEEKAQKNRTLKKICMIVLIVFALYVAYTGFFRLEVITTKGCSFYTEDEVLEYFKQTAADSNTLLFYIKYKYLKKPTIPFVDEYDIEIKGRNKILINIYEKSMISCIKYMEEYFYLDKDGTVIESSSEKVADLPLITGVKFNAINLQEKLSVEKEEIFSVILEISKLINQYELDVDKVNFNYNMEVTLYSHDIRVILGKRDHYDTQLAELSKLLPKAQEKKLKGELDMENFEEGQDKIIFHED